jgi:GxxExxY protein
MPAQPSKVQTPHDDLTYRIIGVALAVYNELGPGFPEEIYRRAMMIGLHDEGLTYATEHRIEVAFRGTAIGSYELDFVVEQCVVVELKAVANLIQVHQQQLIAYLAASGLPVGLLINFGGASLETRRLFPPRAVQASAAYRARKAASG